MSGIQGALITGVSGLNAQSQRLGTISNNVANSNTIGYKRAVVDFSALVNRATNRFFNPGGVQTAPRYNVDIQGLLSPTASVTDMGISGKGFFVVNEGSVPGVGDEYLFTRDGSFKPDKDGYLKNAAGYYLQGWRLDANGQLPTDASALTSLETINTSNIEGSAIETSNVALGANLPASAEVGDTSTTDVLVYDSLGINHTVRFVWTATANPRVWTLTATGATITDVENSAGTGTTNTLSGTGSNSITVTFNTDGTPASAIDNVSHASVLDATTGNIDIEFDFSATGAEPEQTISFNFGNFSTNTTSATTAAGTTWSGGVATYTTGTAHGFQAGDWVYVNGMTPAGYNGLVQVASTPTSTTFTANIANPGASPATVAGTALGPSGDDSDASGITQFGAGYFTSFINQDGKAFGSFLNIGIQADGTVTAFFDNGFNRDIYKLPVAVFANPNGLGQQNGGAYQQTVDSGELILREAGAGDAGLIQASTLEGSNVDIAQEFTDMIITQRAYSANTRVISTADQMLQELIQVTG